MDEQKEEYENICLDWKFKYTNLENDHAVLMERLETVRDLFKKVTKEREALKDELAESKIKVDNLEREKKILKEVSFGLENWDNFFKLLEESNAKVHELTKLLEIKGESSS
jgi:archaellum component FlaC